MDSSGHCTPRHSPHRNSSITPIETDPQLHQPPPMPQLTVDRRTNPKDGARAATISPRTPGTTRPHHRAFAQQDLRHSRQFPHAREPSQPQQPPPRNSTHHHSKCRFPRLPTLNRGQGQRFPENIPTGQAFHDPPQHTRVQSFEHRHPTARILPLPPPWWSTTLRRTHLGLPLHQPKLPQHGTWILLPPLLPPHSHS